jgi:hypothetical protein
MSVSHDERPRPSPRLVAVRALWVAWVLLAAWVDPAAAQVSLFDPRFDEVRRASVAWDQRNGPPREVVDVVCLVPDFATFLEAVATWDEGHFFPILIDDVEYTFKFLRAFRPSRVVRYPTRSAAVAPGVTWERAVGAVGKSWAGQDAPGEKVPRGDVSPTGLGPVPPGVVVSAPDSPSLAGAVALAAGRFQPLLRWETPKRFADVLSFEEARNLSLGLETLIADRVARYDQLGDDCDFVTLAGDYPYRYNQPDGTNAFDDLILRRADSPRRWAFAGRLNGDATLSVYRAMCALFLQPSSALLFNTYAEKEPPWSEYVMSGALSRLSPFLKVNLRNGERAGLSGWHQSFDPVNPFGLLLINTHGNPTSFNLAGGPGHTADIPESLPTAVLIVHSFSATAPDDPQTLAGRWLANGAFVYYGAMNEPYLQAFRPPGLVAAFLAENLPVVAAARQGTAEAFGRPWRLVFFGDPLYRIKPVGKPVPRAASWPPVAPWPAYVEFQIEPDANESRRLNWVLKTAIFRLQAGANPQQRLDLPGALLGIARDRLDPAVRPLYDDLLVDTLLQANRSAELINRLTRIAPAERTQALRRHLETAQMAGLQRAEATRNVRQGLALWDDVIRSPGSADFAKTFTDRVGRISETSPGLLAGWRNRLRAALRAEPDPSNVPVIEGELRRVEEKLGTAETRR